MQAVLLTAVRLWIRSLAETLSQILWWSLLFSCLVLCPLVLAMSVNVSAWVAVCVCAKEYVEFDGYQQLTPAFIDSAFRKLHIVCGLNF